MEAERTQKEGDAKKITDECAAQCNNTEPVVVPVEEPVVPSGHYEDYGHWELGPYLYDDEFGNPIYGEPFWVVDGTIWVPDN